MTTDRITAQLEELAREVRRRVRTATADEIADEIADLRRVVDNPDHPPLMRGLAAARAVMLHRAAADGVDPASYLAQVGRDADAFLESLPDDLTIPTTQEATS
jgi:hypothetical protein